MAGVHEDPKASDHMIALDEMGKDKDDKSKENSKETAVIKQEDSSKTNEFSAARGRIQRYVDVALLMSNMSMIATIAKRQYMFTSGQYIALIATLTIAMGAEILAGVLFFIAHERDCAGKKNHKWLDTVSYTCVGLVMLMNMFASTFSASWTETVPSPTLTPSIPAALNSSLN